MTSIASPGGPVASLQERLLADLQSSGLSSSKAGLVAGEIEAAVQSAASSGGRPDPGTVRDAIEQRLEQDVAAGTITAEDADTVRQALDAMEQKMGGASAAKSMPPPGGGGAPPGGGGGEEEKTEVSRSSTTSGSKTTITITYSDGSTETKTEYGSADSSATSSAQNLLDLLEAGGGNAKTADYLKSMLSRNLIDLRA